MNTSTLRLLLGVSVLFNLGVLAALGWQQLSPGLLNDAPEPLLVRELQQSSQTIQQQHDRLINSIFASPLDTQRIHHEQQALAAQQQQQQQLVLEQLLREREILDEQQRQRLVQLLTRQAPTLEVERLHNQ